MLPQAPSPTNPITHDQSQAASEAGLRLSTLLAQIGLAPHATSGPPTGTSSGRLPEESRGRSWGQIPFPPLLSIPALTHVPMSHQGFLTYAKYAESQSQTTLHPLAGHQLGNLDATAQTSNVGFVSVALPVGTAETPRPAF